MLLVVWGALSTSARLLREWRGPIVSEVTFRKRQEVGKTRLGYYWVYVDVVSLLIESSCNLAAPKIPGKMYVPPCFSIHEELLTLTEFLLSPDSCMPVLRGDPTPTRAECRGASAFKVVCIIRRTWGCA